mgnify:FL=1
MCIICVDLEKEKLTLSEARRNFREMESTLDPEHREEMREKLYPKTTYDYNEALETWWLAGFNYTTGSD